MWYKILLPLAVIAIIYWLGRRHGGKKQDLPPPPPPRPMPPGKRRLLLGFMGLAVAAIVGTAVDWYLDRHEVMLVRVINSQSGNTANYKAERYLIHHRTLETVDGLKVVLADDERMEISKRE